MTRKKGDPRVNAGQNTHRELDDLRVDKEHIGGMIMWGQELGACGRIS